jgi:hypothetical protein
MDIIVALSIFTDGSFSFILVVGLSFYFSIFRSISGSWGDSPVMKSLLKRIVPSRKVGDSCLKGTHVDGVFEF